MGWRYLAQRISGPTAGEFLDTELPLTDVALTDTLSGPLGLSGKLSPVRSALKDSLGRPVLDEWSTAIWAEADGEIRGGGILVRSNFDGPSVGLECMGYTGYLNDLIYDGSWYGVQVDPLDVVRRIWEHAQAQPNGNLGMIVDPTTSPVRIGTELEQVEFDTQSGPISFEAGPIKLAWWLQEGLAQKVDDLAKETPFDYHEEHSWSDGPGSSIVHRLRLGYPQLGRRRDELRFVLGENVIVVPTIEKSGEDYANAVIGLGAGEGRDMVRSPIMAADDGRLRRLRHVIDKTITTPEAATDLARRGLKNAQNLEDVTEIIVNDHPHAPIGSWAVGDEIAFQAETDWTSVDLWVRVVSSTINPASGDAAVLSVVRSDKVGR